jgi:hypothetical protein
VESAQDTDLDLATAGYVLHNKRSSPGGGLVDQMELLNMTSADGTTYGSVWSGRTPPPGYTSDLGCGGGGGGGVGIVSAGQQLQHILDSCASTTTTMTATSNSIGGGGGSSGTLGSMVSCRYNPSVDSAPTPHQTPTQTKLVPPCRACIVRGGGDHMYESPRVGELDGGGVPGGCS